jgi:hypothetical protein|tara:strand:- start:1475 stop:1711 length:237 start_codon:yes stop_codon:yes gene_type:complete
MFQFDKPQYTLIDLKYIYGALMQIEVKGEDVRILSLLQDKTLDHIKQLESLNEVKEPELELPELKLPKIKPGPPGKKV